MMTHVRLMLEYFHPWPNSAGFFFARAMGWFADQGIELEIRVPDVHRGDAREHLSRGEVEFGVVPTKRFLASVCEAEALVAVGAVNQCSLEAIHSVRGNNIARPRDLCGRRVSMNPTPRGIAMLRHLIETDGADPNDVIVVDNGKRELTFDELACGAADASFGSYWPWESVMPSNIGEHEKIVLPIREWGAPDFHSYLLCTSREWAERSGGVLQRFLAVVHRGYRAVMCQPAIAAPIYERVIPYFPRTQIASSLDKIAPTWALHGQWGVIRHASVDAYAHWLYRHDVLPVVPDWSRALMGTKLHAAAVSERNKVRRLSEPLVLAGSAT
ncbi:ABC transporter substrate-binding protein [Trinickia sp. LjRoot230]|uniref:ABC transporter substrate-binding protein n=1 Tax=Trinickia sp. LjRoot230 TaxID=3342288 RepID=UPI003F5040D9